MIPSKLYRRLTIVMAFLVLFGNIGIVLVEHQCMMKGRSVNLAGYNYFEVGKKGCSMDHSLTPIDYDKPAFHKKGCCSDQFKYGKISVLSSSYTSFLKFLKAFSACFVPESLFNWVPVSKIQLLRVFEKPPYFDSILRVYGRSLLIHIQSFLI